MNMSVMRIAESPCRHFSLSVPLGQSPGLRDRSTCYSG
jgi:hypothetical protein